MLRAHIASGAPEPTLEPWRLRFSGPFLYYPRASPRARAAARIRRLSQRRRTGILMIDAEPAGT